VSRLGRAGWQWSTPPRHPCSGRTRALKIARSDDAAEERYAGEYQVLSTLDLRTSSRDRFDQMVEERLTLVMERVKDGAFFTCVSTERGREAVPGFGATVRSGTRLVEQVIGEITKAMPVRRAHELPHAAGELASL